MSYDPARGARGQIKDQHEVDSKPAPFGKAEPKGCATQDRVAALRVRHPRAFAHQRTLQGHAFRCHKSIEAARFAGSPEKQAPRTSGTTALRICKR